MVVIKLLVLMAPQGKPKFMVALPAAVRLVVLEIRVTLIFLQLVVSMFILAVMENTHITEVREEAVPLVYQPQVV
jgi:hypothetical protein